MMRQKSPARPQALAGSAPCGRAARGRACGVRLGLPQLHLPSARLSADRVASRAQPTGRKAPMFALARP